ncbi:hypothetical protein CP975_30410 [Streptomyces alboniger]|uniref:Uncharacterized protein n=1 Tax=Streptomyces alboniger TaxID=132473 RepID=A0A5J6HSF2_STRAD|nr:hypothetical protein CP975_30410 [Streptomyces alboniger]
MRVSTFEAAAVAMIALLPGALYLFAVERETAVVRAGLADRVIRVAATAALFHLALAPLTAWAYLRVWESGRLTRPPVPWAWWWLPLPYVVVPLLAGFAVGSAFRRGRRWARIVNGQTPEPLAWDALFGHDSALWLRIRLRDTDGGTNGWILGVFARDARGQLDSRASAYPQPHDLYLCDTAAALPDGSFRRGADGRPVLRNIGLLISREEITYIEVMWG